MKPRSLAILAGVFGLLLLGFFLMQRSRERTDNAELKELFPELDLSTVSKLLVKTSDREVVLDKQTGLWTVAPEGHKADQAAVQELLDQLEGMEMADVTSTNPAKAATFDVDEGGQRTVEVKAFAGADLAAHFFVGKSGPDYSSSYVRLAGGDRIVRTRGAVRNAFDRGQRTWRDRTIFSIFKDDIATVSLVSPELTATLTPSGEGPARTWAVTSEEAEWPGNTATIDSLVTTLANLSADAFAPPELTAEEAGLVDPERRAAITLKDGTSHELLMGHEAEQNRHYATRVGEDFIFNVGKYRINQIFKPLDDLKATPSAPAGEPAQP